MKSSHVRGLLVGLLALAVVGAPLASAASAGSITASPSTPGATATHTATATAGNATAGSWNGFAVDYGNTDADLSNVSEEDIVKIGIDRGDDESGDTIDVNVSDDVSSVSASNEGRLLKVSLGGNYNLKAGDEVVVVYEDARNPTSAGSYTIPLDINYQSSGGETSATLAIGDTETTQTETMTDETTAGETTAGETTAADETTADETTKTTNGGGPGFGVLAVVGAFVALALVALRRD